MSPNKCSKMEHLRIVVQLSPQMPDKGILDDGIKNNNNNNSDGSTPTTPNDCNCNNNDNTPTTTNNNSSSSKGSDSNNKRRYNSSSASSHYDEIDNDAFQNTTPVIVELIDTKTLQLQIGNSSFTPTQQQMHFDFVGQASAEHCLKQEMSQLMDELLLSRRNCCLVRFVPRRDCHLTLLHNLLVTEVNKRLLQLNARVHFIKVDYRDIVREGARDLLHGDVNANDEDDDDVKNPVALSRWLQSCSRTGAFNASGSVGGANDHFCSTRDLLLWLLNEYRLKCSTTQGHEVLVFHFFIVGAQQQMFKVKFALFNVYLTKMDAEARFNWQKYMDRLGGGGNCSSAFVHSPLTKCLSDYFEISGCGRTLLMFDVPTSLEGHCSSDAYDLLKMAHVVAKNRKKERNTFGRMCRSRSSSIKTPDNASGVADAETTSPVNMIAVTPSSVCFTIPIKPDKETKRRRLSHDVCTKKDLRTLSNWHGKIDAHFQATRDCMEQFYAHRVDASLVQMRSNVKAMARDIDHECEALDMESSAEITSNELELAQHIAQQYKASFDAAQQLAARIETSNYADILKIYFEMKRFELTQHALHLKIKNLECYRQRLTASIDEEVCTLNGMLYQEAEDDTLN